MTKEFDNSRGPTYAPYVILVTGLALSATSLRFLSLSYESHDWNVYLHEWYSHIIAHGRFHALGDQFSNYAPPYLYLLSIVSLLDGIVPDLILVKSISVVFDILCSIVVFKIILLASQDKEHSLVFSLLFLNLPTVILNGSYWGQCDIIYVTFLLYTAYLILQKHQYIAMATFGVALSFKLQSIFLAPFLIYLVLTRAIRASSILMIPVFYGLFLLPAALAGRPLLQLVGVYQGQVTTNEPLVMSAPNFLLFVTKLVPSIGFGTGMAIGLGLAVLATSLLLLSNFRRQVTGKLDYFICAATLYLAIEPYFLPKMHDRYFFGADVFAFVLFAVGPRNWLLPLLFQIGSGLAYLAYFASNDSHLLAIAGPARYLGGLAMTAALVALTREYLRTPLKSGAWRFELAN
jgi:Gpi18-like mannosyltransferase